MLYPYSPKMYINNRFTASVIVRSGLSYVYDIILISLLRGEDLLLMLINCSQAAAEQHLLTFKSSLSASQLQRQLLLAYLVGILGCCTPHATCLTHSARS